MNQMCNLFSPNFEMEFGVLAYGFQDNVRQFMNDHIYRPTYVAFHTCSVFSQKCGSF
jgi:hypothetical protein